MVDILLKEVDEAEVGGSHGLVLLVLLLEALQDLKDIPTYAYISARTP